MIVEDCALRYRCDQCHKQIAGFNAALTHARCAHTVDKSAQTDIVVFASKRPAPSSTEVEPLEKSVPVAVSDYLHFYKIQRASSLQNRAGDDDDKADTELETSEAVPKAVGMKVHKSKGDRYSSEVKARAVELYANGMNMERIAAELGVATSWTISRWLARANVAKHKPYTLSSPVLIKRADMRRSKVNTYTPEARQRAVDLYKSGMNMSRIAAKLGVSSVWTISRWLTTANEKRGNRDKIIYTPEQRKRALQMFNKGASASAVAREFGCTTWTACKWWRQAYEQNVLHREETSSVRKRTANDDTKWLKQEANTTLV